MLVFLSANVGAGRLADVARDWRPLPPSAHERGMEVVLQTHLFAGFPRTINGRCPSCSSCIGSGRQVAAVLASLPAAARRDRVWGISQTEGGAGLATIERVGVQCETTAWAEEPGDPEQYCPPPRCPQAAARARARLRRLAEARRCRWRLQGEESCAKIYGNVYEKLRKRMGKLHPIVDRWEGACPGAAAACATNESPRMRACACSRRAMVQHGYGRIISRAGLTLRMRELAVVAVLAGMDVAPQLNSHLRGALLVAASTRRALAHACPLPQAQVGLMPRCDGWWRRSVRQRQRSVR